MSYCSVNHNRNRCMQCGYEDAQTEMKVSLNIDCF